MKKAKSERGSISVFVIVAFIFCMTILVNIYWSSTNYQISVLQAAKEIKDIYGEDFNRASIIQQMLPTPVPAPTPTPIPIPTPTPMPTITVTP